MEIKADIINMEMLINATITYKNTGEIVFTILSESPLSNFINWGNKIGEVIITIININFVFAYPYLN